MPSSPLPPYPGHLSRHSRSGITTLGAAVLGANDGIVSVASIIVGVAGASSSSVFIFTAGLSGLVAGALSMGVGEYVSVSSQRDTQKAILHTERQLLNDYPTEERAELAKLYEKKGLSRKTALFVASELSTQDVSAARFDAELGIESNDLNNPWHALIASTISFSVGAAIPLVAVFLTTPPYRIVVTFIAVIIALVTTGLLSARMTESAPARVIRRILIGGLLCMAVTYLIGRLIGGVGV
jgi:VIT1/CCC1 family predicted Fe2+/Mn2+ transporter